MTRYNNVDGVTRLVGAEAHDYRALESAFARRLEPVASGDVVGLQGRCELHRIAISVFGFPGFLESAEQEVRSSGILLCPVGALLQHLFSYYELSTVHNQKETES